MKTCTTYVVYVIIHHNDHCKNHIDVDFPYTHTHTHDNQICKLLYSVHGVRCRGAGQGTAVPRFERKVFNIISPQDFGSFCSEIFVVKAFEIKFLELRE